MNTGDMIECYKTTHGVYEIPQLLKLNTNSNLRGHPFKLKMTASNRTIRHNYFSIRVVNKWNSLSEVVVSAPSLNSFKRRLDNHWKQYKFCLTPLPSRKLATVVNEEENEFETVVQASA